MKRIVLGCSILGVLLALAVLFSAQMGRMHAPLSKALQAAADASAREDWAAAQQLADKAAADWERCKHFTAALADHSPMDEIDSLFCELTVYLEEREMPHFAATCRHLATLTEAMMENHALSWWNLL